MKLSKVFLILVVVLALVLSIAALPQEQEAAAAADDDGDVGYELTELSDETADFSSERGFGRILAQKKRKSRRITCNKFPRICRSKGSPGPFCCKKKCVNVLTDRFNCGACGKKCKYNQICCNGKCVNPTFNRKHCGGCNNRCKNGGFCAFGLCNYA
ncbi:stigma-specific STIG1-like protein 1 [Manihot esculenta]|uniref:Stigma-specific STIG1-like protein 1 n=1 Tax=Manihot esculenta TaxID=3983 RepID=A0A2C9W8P0_MANES|nr:stigma-specific STIG1-like protein 1 [Manihot esculenta]OAY55172.1 hypothetical protein MANES_03G133500v8 [Manihot esculenta]